MADHVFLYDFLAARGGAERVLQTLVAEFGGQSIVGFVNEDLFSGDNALADVVDLGAYSALPALKMYRVCSSFSKLNLDAFNARQRVFSGSYAVLAARNSKGGENICYCHTPPRFLYDLRDYYAQTSSPAMGIALKAFGAWFKPQYEQSMAKMHTILANSLNVQRRLKAYLNLESRVVYPPVETSSYRWLHDGDYYVSTARLEPLKRVDLIVKAFLRIPDKKLVVASGGSMFDELRKLSANAPNIHFTGWITDAQSADLLGGARASIYIPIDEDFGMSPVESMAAGKPVIGVAEGGLVETILHGETGHLLPKNPSTENLIDALNQLDRLRPHNLRFACEKQAACFSRARFTENIRRVLATPHAP